MADTAFQIQYRQEAVMGFESRTSLLRASVTTEAVIKGNQAVFMVADTNGATTTTRGVNGRIPTRTDNLNQYTATLVETHDKAQRTSFNIFASQGDGRRLMQETSMAVVNRSIDLDILGELANATNSIATAQTASLALVMKARTKLGNNQVPIEQIDKMFAVVSPAFMSYLYQVPEFSNSQWVDIQPMTGPSRKVQRWAGFNWVEQPLVTGVATAAELCYFYHQDAIGHAVNSGEMQALAGYDEAEDASWARTTIYQGSKLLQNKGIVKVTHDGSAYA